MVDIEVNLRIAKISILLPRALHVTFSEEYIIYLKKITTNEIFNPCGNGGPFVGLQRKC